MVKPIPITGHGSVIFFSSTEKLRTTLTLHVFDAVAAAADGRTVTNRPDTAFLTGLNFRIRTLGSNLSVTVFQKAPETSV